MKLNEYQKKRNKEVIRKANEEPKEKLSIEEVTEQFKRIRQGRINRDVPQ